MATAVAEIQIHPIGFFRGTHSSKSSLPRQGIRSTQTGKIEFQPGFDHTLALSGLERMSHVWVIFYFHEAHSAAKPLVRPPRAPDEQVGVYATRAPYRPNKLGLTLAQIETVQDGKLIIKNSDLLDGTPILDLKPYSPESDRPEISFHGWIDNVEVWSYELSHLALEQSEWLKAHGLHELDDVFEAQLGTPPLEESRKRIQKNDDKTWRLAWRTWRFLVEIDVDQKTSNVLEILSGYSQKELAEESDPYHDKILHRNFQQHHFSFLKK